MLTYKIMLKKPQLFKYVNQIEFLNSLEENEFKDYWGFFELIDKIYNYSKIDDKYFVKVLKESREYRNFDCAYRFKNICYLLSEYDIEFFSDNFSFFYDMIELSKFLPDNTKIKLALELLKKRNNLRYDAYSYYYNKIIKNLSNDGKLKIETIRKLYGT